MMVQTYKKTARKPDGIFKTCSLLCFFNRWPDQALTNFNVIIRWRFFR